VVGDTFTPGGDSPVPPAPDPFVYLQLFGPFLGPVLPFLKAVLMPAWDALYQAYVLAQVSHAVGPVVAAGVTWLMFAVVFAMLALLILAVLLALTATGVMGLVVALVVGSRQQA
jgi:hypothetical protein